jgi:hypothetical protein
MKIQHFLLTVIAAAAFVVAGCSKSADGTVSVDTSKLTAVFSTAEADAKTAVDSVATAVKNADYAGAMTQLKALGEKHKLTPEQQQEVKNLLGKVQKAAEDAASKAAGEAGKAATDLGNTIKK